MKKGDGNREMRDGNKYINSHLPPRISKFLPLHLLILYSLILMLGFTPQASAAPQALYIQGRITDAAGNPVFGSRNITIWIKHPSMSPDYGKTLTVYPNEMGFFEVVIEGGSFPNFDLETLATNKYTLMIDAAGSDPYVKDICSVPYAIDARLLQGLPPKTSGTDIHIVKTTASGEVAFGVTSAAAGTAVKARGVTGGMFLRGGTYGAIAQNGAKGAANTQKQEGVRAIGKNSLEIGRGNIYILPWGWGVYSPPDYNTAGTALIAAGSRYSGKIYNNFIYNPGSVHGSIILLTTKKAGSSAGEKVWVDEMSVESSTKRPYFIIGRSTTEGTSYVNWLILNK